MSDEEHRKLCLDIVVLLARVAREGGGGMGIEARRILTLLDAAPDTDRRRAAVLSGRA